MSRKTQAQGRTLSGMSETVGLCVAPNGKMSVHGDKDILQCLQSALYSKEMQEKIKEVMKYAGPRMLFYHPLQALDHMWVTMKGKIKKR